MKTVCPIQEGWKLGGFDSDGFVLQAEIDSPDVEWFDILPCEDVHTALIRLGKIGDPAIGTNDEACRWVEKKIWVYRTTFDAPKGVPWLNFEGLDTFAEIYLNGKLAAHFENMLVPHVLNVSEWIREKNNDLIVCFYPVHERCTARALPEGFWINYSTDRAYARKAGYSFGWDWTPRVLTVGIWRPVTLIGEGNGLLGSLRGDTISIAHESATVCLRAKCLHEPTGNVSYRFTVVSPNGENQVQICSTESKVTLTLDEPKLWWTHDLGRPELYTIVCELLVDGQMQDRMERKMGVRTVQMELEDESGAKRFVVCLNGRKLCARGANWVPMSNRPASVRNEMYTQLIECAKAAGMNLLNLWGGGIYEQDVFYDECDRIGILVWQYFMFACGEYPDYDPLFVAQVKDEIGKVVDRLSYHPCLAMWIGNVESEMICQKIGLERPMHGADLFEKQIPEWMKEQDPERFYLPSSPWGEKLMNGEEAYDHHNWDVWFKNLPYTEYANDHTTFASEFGVHAAPILATVKKGCGENVQLDDFAFHYFNRDQDLQCMTYYLKMHAGEPETLETYIDLSMLVQAEALSFACEHYRRRFPACGGALIWQLNDCCPCQSWSLIDVNLNPKAAYYAVKRSFAPVTVSLKVIDACTTEIWALNDSAEERKLRITVEVGSFVGEVDHQEALEIALQPGERRCIRRIAVGGRFYPNVIIGNRPRLYYLAAWLEGQPRPQIRFFVEHKERLMPRAALAVSTGSGRISIATHVFADFVKLDGDLEGLEVSDNYFHMPPHTSRTIEVTRIWGKPLAQRKIFIKALNSDAVGVTMTE